MWSRDVEIMIGCWLAMSPFIFGHPSAETAWWINDFACALAVVTLAGSSYWKPLRYAHLGQLAVGTWLIGFAYFHGFGAEGGTPAALQNTVSVGLLLSMFGLIPNNAADPPLYRRVDRSNSMDTDSAGCPVDNSIASPSIRQPVEHV